MSAPITFAATVPVLLFTRCWTVEELCRHIKQEDADRVIGMPSFGARAKGLDDEGRYTEVGEAQVTITLHSNDKLVTLQLESLQGMLQAERAATVVRQNAILQQISKLQAITYDGGVAV